MSKKNRQTRRQRRSTAKPATAKPQAESKPPVLDQTAYRHFIHKKYPDLLAQTRQQQADFHGRVCTHTTANVQLNKLLAVCAPLMGACLDPVCITITPECYSMMCHQNACFVEMALGWKCKVGFNVTACRCGACLSLELHSVNINDDGDYVDFTTDFGDEKQKWFIPFRSNTPISILPDLLPEPYAYAVGKSKCKCGDGRTVLAPPINFAVVNQALNVTCLML
jgi:hypothetical protein